MEVKQRKKQNIITLLLTILIIITINVISSKLFERFDLTSEKRYTLSNHTKNLLKELDDEIYIKIYLDGNDLPVNFKKMRKSINELLEEFSVYAENNITYEFINPTAETNQKARFNLYKQLYDRGLSPIESQEVDDEGKTSQKMIFPGAIVIYKGNEIGINLLKNDGRFKRESEQSINSSIEALEYEFTNSIRKLSIEKKEQIAFIEGHAELSDYEVMSITKTLSEYYDVKRGKISGMYGILDNFKAIVIAKPRFAFSKKDKFVIDQYVMNGGKILWLVDGVRTDMDSLVGRASTVAMPNILNIDDLLFKYGARINYDLIQDVKCAPIGLTRKDRNGKTKIDRFSWFYFPLLISRNNHEINKYIDLIRTEFVSSIDTVGTSANIKKTILLNSSNYTKLETGLIEVKFDIIRKKPNQQEFSKMYVPVAVLLEGEFNSVFQNRNIDSLIPDKTKFKTKSINTKMIIVSDGDIIKNYISEKGEVYPLGYDKYTNKFSKRIFEGNKEFILNAINYLCDDNGLMSIRLREIKLRLLDKRKIKQYKLKWQIINTLLPIIFIIFFGLILHYLRKRKYVHTK